MEWSKFTLTTFSTAGQHSDSEANLFLLRPKRRRQQKKPTLIIKKNSLNLSWSSHFDVVIFTKWLFICLYFVLRNSTSNFIVKGKKKTYPLSKDFFVSSGLCRLLVALCRSFVVDIVWPLVSIGQTFHIFRCYF